MPRRCALIVIAVLATTIARGAIARAGSAEDYAEARRMKASLDWDHALALAERALADGDADPARVRALHELAGELAAGLDRDDVAIAHFDALLALAPDATLPAGTSPKIAARFDVARDRARTRRGLTVHAAIDPIGLAVVVDEDPLAMVTGARARFTSGRAPGEIVVRGTGTIAIAIPKGATQIELAAIDARGNALWVGGAPAIATAPRGGAHHHWGATTTWSVVAGGSLALGTIAAWRFRAAQDEWDALRADDTHHDYSELTAVETRGRRWALAADVAFGAAAVTGVIAIVVGIREAGRDEDHLQVAPLVTRDAFGVALGARF
ncbi:MAG TPA: hypothetical protein VL463_34965 [Kofleriaceae bacterium]|nr:hypothetical protein [Kofleriaceae bacterium]